MSDRKGYTLIELMVAVSIVGLLAALAVPAFRHARRQTQRRQIVNNLRVIDQARRQALSRANAVDFIALDRDRVERELDEGDLARLPWPGRAFGADAYLDPDFASPEAVDAWLRQAQLRITVDLGAGPETLPASR